MEVELTKLEASSLRLIDKPYWEDEQQQVIMCEINKEGDMVRLVGTIGGIRPIIPKPCPFCGSEELWIGHARYRSSSISCRVCGVSIVVDWPDYDPRCARTYGELERWSTLKAIARWNRRSYHNEEG